MQSKYKNPDKFIEKLKKTIDWLLEILDTNNDTHEAQLEELTPEHIVNWRQATRFYQQQLGSTRVNSPLLKLRVGDTILHEGEVTAINASKNGTDIDVEFKRIYRKNGGW